MRLDWTREAEAVALLTRLVPGGDRGFHTARCAGVVNSDSEVVAGLACHDWNPEGHTIEISAAATDSRWLTRGVARDLFAYCFSFCQAVVTRTTEDNEAVRKIWRSLGATEHVIPRMAGRDRALVVFVLGDDAWASSKWR